MNWFIFGLCLGAILAFLVKCKKSYDQGFADGENIGFTDGERYASIGRKIAALILLMAVSSPSMAAEKNYNVMPPGYQLFTDGDFFRHKDPEGRWCIYAYANKQTAINGAWRAQYFNDPAKWKLVEPEPDAIRLRTDRGIYDKSDAEEIAATITSVLGDEPFYIRRDQHQHWTALKKLQEKWSQRASALKEEE